MRIIFVINGLGTGGAERSLAEMLPAFRRHGIDAKVVCLYRRNAGVQETVHTEGNGVTFLGSRMAPARWRELRHLLRQETPDIVHTTIYEADILGRLASIGLGSTVVTSLVNTSYEPVRLGDPRVSRWKLAAAKWLDGMTARWINDHFHAITETVKTSAVRHLGISPGRVTVVHRGRDPERLGRPSPERREAARQRWGIGADENLLVNLGRREYQKGQEHLLRAFEILDRDGIRVKLIVAGRSGSASDQLQGMRSGSPGRDRIVFLGHIDDVPELLAAADLFVFPSLYEGLGTSLIEAMALGLPIVASDLPAIREVVEPDGNAILVEPADPRQLAVAMSNLLADRDRVSRFGRRSREIFEAHFTLERSVVGMIEMYERILAR